MGERRLKLKFCLIGSESVGKTCFANQLDSKPFQEEYEPTFGLQFLIYFSSLDDTDIKNQIYDCSGKENCSELVNEFCRTSNGVLAFYDITNENSFLELKSKLEPLKSILNTNSTVILIGNKLDLWEQRAVSKEDAEIFAKNNKFLFTEISLKSSTTSAQETLKKLTENVIRKIELSNQDNFTSRSVNFVLPTIFKQNQNSARSQKIDVMSNSILVSSSSHINRFSEVENQKFITDLVDQIKMLKSSNEKKDRLISKLSSLSEPKKEPSNEICEIERFKSIERNVSDNAKKELEAKYNSVSFQLSEEKAKVFIKEEKISEQKNEIDLLKVKIEEIQSESIEKLNKISELENEIASYENVRQKSTITINVLQKDNKELQSKIFELESKNRELLMEQVELKANFTKNKEQIKMIFNTFELSESETFETICEKLKTIKTENLISKGKSEEFSHLQKFIEAENKTNTEVISELRNEIRNLESKILEYKASIRNLNAEKDAAISSKEIIVQKMDELKEKTNNTQQVWLSVSKKLEIEEQKCGTFESKLKAFEKSLIQQESEFKDFVEELASLLSDNFFKVESTKHDIKEKVKLLMLSSRHRGLMIASLENAIKNLSHDFDAEAEQKSDYKLQIDSMQTVLESLKDKIFDLETKLNEKESRIQSMLSEREKVIRVVENLAITFEIPSENLINSVPSLDKCIEIISYKINTKKIIPEPVNTDKILNDKQINFLQEQILNKDIHLELLRKKLADLEEEKLGRSDIRTEYDKLIQKNKRMEIKNERLKQELDKFKSENSQLKSHILDINNLKFQIVTKDTEIDKQKLRIAELETKCDGFLIRVGNLREDIDSTNNHLDQTKSLSNHSIKELSEELRSLKIEFNKTKTREHQLLDFRNLVAKKVGLEMNSLSVPDYEIIARIEFFVNGRVHMISHFPLINNIQF